MSYQLLLLMGLITKSQDWIHVLRKYRDKINKVPKLYYPDWNILLSIMLIKALNFINYFFISSLLMALKNSVEFIFIGNF